MSAKKPNISQIDQYLKGKLDARAMHKLERQAQDDPFLMDALEGYENAGVDQQDNLEQLREKLAKRIAPAKERSIILWRVLPIAASVLLMLGLGYWFLKPEPVKQQYANVLTPAKPKPQVVVSPPTQISESRKKSFADNLAVTAPPVVAMAQIPVDEPTIPNDSKINTTLRSEVVLSTMPWVIYKNDTVEYTAKNYTVRPNAPVEDVLKKLEGIEVEPNGNITYQGEAVTKVKLNGKDFTGGDVTQAARNLPADIIDKIQVVDDYGDQAAKTGIRPGEPQKVLNFTTDSVNKKGLLANNRQVLKEVVVTNSVESKMVGRAAGAANRQVVGMVLDTKGTPLPGVTVKVDGTTNAVTTDVNSNFKIDLPSNKDLLALNYVGFSPKQVRVGDQKDLKIALDENLSNLNEVVVMSYSRAKKKATTCNENLRFKKKFFDNVSMAENYTNEQLANTKHTIKEKALKKALEFLSKYTKVPVTANYYDAAAFQADKNQWLNWYEANKCNNLK